MPKPLLDDAVLKLIDAKLLLNGHVTSKDISGSMVYVPAKKKYMATDDFKPCFLGDVKAGEFVDALITVFGTFTDDE